MCTEGDRKKKNRLKMAENGKAFAFSSAFRIKKRMDFKRIFQEGRRVRGKWASYVLLPNGLTISRLGLSIGKRYGNAVTRNRAKRIIREAFRLQRKVLPQGFDIVVLPNSDMPPLQLKDFGKEMKEILTP